MSKYNPNNNNFDTRRANAANKRYARCGVLRPKYKYEVVGVRGTVITIKRTATPRGYFK